MIKSIGNSNYSPVALRQLAEVERLCVYVFYLAIFNKKYNKIYIGQTGDLMTRLDLHNQGTFSNSYTSRFDGGWTLIYSEEKLSRKEALLREKQLKSYRGREFIKKHIPL